jgi:hypothetical protein
MHAQGRVAESDRTFGDREDRFARQRLHPKGCLDAGRGRGRAKDQAANGKLAGRQEEAATIENERHDAGS